jgi:hypothetical protein
LRSDHPHVAAAPQPPLPFTTLHIHPQLSHTLSALMNALPFPPQ